MNRSLFDEIRLFVHSEFCKSVAKLSMIQKTQEVFGISECPDQGQRQRSGTAARAARAQADRTTGGLILQRLRQQRPTPSYACFTKRALLRA